MAGTRQHDDEIDALLQDRLEDVRAEWREHHGRVPMSPVTETDVSEILLLLAKHGVPPTVRAVRDVVGAGSLSALTPMVRAAWIRKELPQRLATLERGQAVPDRLLQFWDLLLTDATAKAKELLYRQTRELDERRAGLDGREEALMHKEQVIDERVAGMLAQVATAEASVTEMRGTLAERSRERDALQAELQSSRDAHLAEVRKLRERLDVSEREAATARERLAVREGELATLRTALGAETRRADEAKVLADQARTEATAASKRADRLVLERAQLDLEFAGARAELARSAERAQRVDVLEQDVVTLRAEHASLRASYDLRSSDLLQHQATIAQLRADARVADRIETELKGAREELRTVIRDRDLLLRNPPALLTRMEAMEKVLQQILESTAQRGG
jgi:chromosome segregation ATPase